MAEEIQFQNEDAVMLQKPSDHIQQQSMKIYNVKTFRPNMPVFKPFSFISVFNNKHMTTEVELSCCLKYGDKYS